VEVSGKWAGLITAFIFGAALLAGQPLYGFGVCLGSAVACLLYRWQLAALHDAEGLATQKSLNRILIRTYVKFFASAALLLLSLLGGPSWVLGVSTGLVIQAMLYMGGALYAALRKGGKA